MIKTTTQVPDFPLRLKTGATILNKCTAHPHGTVGTETSSPFEERAKLLTFTIKSSEIMDTPPRGTEDQEENLLDKQSLD